MELFKTEPTHFAQVILPFATPKPYTFHIPDEWVEQVKFGIRVEVQFGTGRDLYAAVVIAVNDKKPDHKTKPILQVIDSEPIISTTQLAFWEWLASYYACTLGEVMNAALPTNMKLSSETRIVLNPDHDQDFSGLDDKEYLVAEALTIQKELTIDQIQKILGQKTVYPIVNRLLMYDILDIKEELQYRFKPKMVSCVRLKEPYRSDPSVLGAAFDLVKNSEKQTNAMLAFVQLQRQEKRIRTSEVCAKANIDLSVLRAIEKKGIWEIFESEISRVGGYEDDLIASFELSDQQTKAIYEIKKNFETKNVTLLHGVTGSGKTRVYTELIEAELLRGGQVLYLIPEIALTTQIINRLQKIFGEKIAVYHSKLNGNERVELWQQTLAGKPIILGVRSSLFLPFKNLTLIIVDEEHDSSFKQQDPSPRYNARDAAIFLASLTKAKVLLGTATPSVETYFNAQQQKYGLVEMTERFGGLQLPEIEIVDSRTELKNKTMVGNFTSRLVAEMKSAVGRGEQIILFQNRRGYAPTMSCTTCGWTSECRNCDVSLTYHKFANTLNCHYCGYTIRLPKECPACGATTLNIKGFGTERIEDELKIHLPEARVGRLDLDTARTKTAHSKIINDFEERQIDVLVGTQMVTKGLDFENVGLVGVLSADNLLKFPDFRASERAFQLLLQVSGRAGRKNKQGKVIIQAFDVKNLILQDVQKNDFSNFFKREILERKNFIYPPFYRLIGINIKHKKPDVLRDASKIFTKILKERLGERVQGPAVPLVERVNTYYILNYLIKMERDVSKLTFAKQIIQEATYQLNHTEGYSNVRVLVDVDPY
ncbi:MAG: primosomal protein N' [Saprospiraceae bacterium]|nr:primosomal protein N' [Saprospiraceae bacterium]